MRWSSPEISKNEAAPAASAAGGGVGEIGQAQKSYSMPAARQPSCRKVRVSPYQAWANCSILPYSQILSELVTCRGPPKTYKKNHQRALTGVSLSATVDVDTVCARRANHLETSSRAQVRFNSLMVDETLSNFESTLVGGMFSKKTR